MLESLKTHFGYDAFLPLQKEVVSSVMAGRDTFALMPIGGRKSLCYQLPAMALPGLIDSVWLGSESSNLERNPSISC